MRILAGLLAAAAVVVLAATWLQAPLESTFAPPTADQVIQQAESILSGSELGAQPEGAATDEKDKDEEAKEEKPPRRPASYKAVRSFDEDGYVEGEAIDSTGADESALAVTSAQASVTVLRSTLSRTSPSSTGGLLSSTYGVGSALLAAPGQLYVGDCEATTNAAGGFGLFALGRSFAYIADSTVQTQQAQSGGLRAVEGASLYAFDTEVRTEGEDSPALSIGQDGGVAVAQGGILLTTGLSSPAFYSQGDMAAVGLSASAGKSPAALVEGKNILRLFDCRISCNPRRDPRDDFAFGVALYQGSEADSSTGRTTFQMTGGRMDVREGGLFYVTNTQAAIVLQSARITGAADTPFLLRCTGNTGSHGWGEQGSNGAICSLTCIDQEVAGDVVWDALSQVTVYLTEGSRLEGAVVRDDSTAGNPTSAMAKGQANLVVDKQSAWIVTGDSVLSSLSCEGVLSDAEGRPVTVKSPDGATFVKGTSPYTVTVTDFSIDVDVSSATQPADRASFEVERPDVLAPAAEEAALAELEEGEAEAVEDAQEAVQEAVAEEEPF